MEAIDKALIQSWSHDEVFMALMRHLSCAKSLQREMAHRILETTINTIEGELFKASLDPVPGSSRSVLKIAVNEGDGVFQETPAQQTHRIGSRRGRSWRER